MVQIGEASIPPTIDVPAYCTKQMTNESATFAAELNAVPIAFPCALVQAGSATTCAIVSYCRSVVVGMRTADECLIDCCSHCNEINVTLLC